MPGKVNPVMPEMVIQVAAQVIGNDAAITFCGQGGFLELNTMLPVIALNLIESIEILASAAGLFAEKCVAGITANLERCRSYIEQSLALSTYLVPVYRIRQGFGNIQGSIQDRQNHPGGCAWEGNPS